MTGLSLDISAYDTYLRPRPGLGDDEKERLAQNLLGPRKGQDLFALVAALAARRSIAELQTLYSGRTPLHDAIDNVPEFRSRPGLPGAPFRPGEMAGVHALRALAALGLTLAAEEPDPHWLRTALAWHQQACATPPGITPRWTPGIAGDDRRLRQRLDLLASVAAPEQHTAPALAAAVTLLRLAHPTAEPSTEILFARPAPARAPAQAQPASGPGPSSGRHQGPPRRGLVTGASSWLRSHAGRQRPHGVTVLFDRGREGSKAVLTAAVLGGLPPALIPDPERMAMFAADASFQEALGAAWKQAGQKAGGTVLWAAEQAVGPQRFATGESAGAAFAVILDEARRLRRPLAALLVLRRLLSRPAVVGKLDSLGSMQSVGGYDAKLSVLGATAMVILPATDHEKARAAAGSAGVDPQFVPAQTWKDAARKARGRSTAVLVREALTVALAGLLAAGGIIGVQHARAGHAVAAADNRAAASRLLSTASQLRSLAEKAGNGTVPDLQTQAQLLLAASSLARQAGRPGIADQIAGGSVTSGPGVTGPVSADLGGIQGIYPDGGDVIATSQKGKIALIDSSTRDVDGIYTEPPGTETIDQPVVTGLALAPNAWIFAAVFQNPVPSAGANAPATLRIFSAAARLTLIGSSADFATSPVSALGYAPGGGGLITTTASTATYWNTTRATPTITGTCALPAEPGRAPVALLTDPGTQDPVIVESDSSVISLPSWNLARSGQSCGATQLIGSWAGEIAAPQTVNGYVSVASVTAGTTPSGGVVIAARTAGGKVRVRSLTAAAVTTLPLKAPATDVGVPGDSLAVQTGSNAGSKVELWDLGSLARPVLTASYARHTLPAAFPGGPGFATASSGDVIDALNTQPTTYPAGIVRIGGISYGTAAGQRALAVDYPGAIAIYSISARKQATYLTTPAGYALADGDGRAGATFAMSNDGQYVAAIMRPGSPLATEPASAQRSILLWDATAGTQTALPALLKAPQTPLHRPLDLRFVPGTDDLLVNYLDGALYRLTPDGSTWRAVIIRQPASSLLSYGMGTGPGGIYLIRQSPPASSGPATDQVLRLSYTGKILRRWNIAPLHVTEASVVPLSDNGALLIDNGGDAYRLRPDGKISQGTDLNTQVVIEGAQIPGTNSVLLATQGLSEIYNLSQDVAEPGAGPGDPTSGPYSNFAATPDGRYLIASDIFDLSTDLGALTPQDKTGNLCNIAGGMMTRREWAYYIGAAAAYRNPCAMSQPGLEDFYNAARQGQRLPPELVRTPSPSDVTRYQGACRAPEAAGFTVTGPFAWKRTTPDEPICSNHKLRWIVPASASPSIRAGVAAGHEVLVVAGKPSSVSASQPASTGIDILLPGGTADSATTGAETISITRAGVECTGADGGVLIEDTFGPDQHGYWSLLGSIPVGPAGTRPS